MKIHRHTYTQQLEQQHTNCGTDYDYYVNDSTEVTAGGTTINITEATKLKQIPVEKCTITIKYANGTQTTVEVRKGSTYTLDTKLKWKVGDTTYDGGSNITVNENITIEESNQITIIYKVENLPEKGLNEYGQEVAYKYDGIAIPTVNGASTYTVTVNYLDGTAVESLSSPYVTPYEDTSTRDRILLEFAGWMVKSTSQTLELNVESLTWEQLYSYAENGVVELSTTWNTNLEVYQYANFYINLYSQAADWQGNVAGRPSINYTPSLWATYVGNTTIKTTAHDIQDTTADNSFGADKQIRALVGDKGDGSVYLYDFPSDEYILEQLKKYAENLSLNGQLVDPDELDTEHYEIRWYVFKDHNRFYHIDGKLVRKEGKMIITKTFTGSKEAIETVTGYSFDTKTSSTNTDYYIAVTGGATNIRLYLKEDILYCDKEEHTHSSECYNEANELICGKEEHTHTKPACISQAVKIKDETTTVDDVTTYRLTYTWVVDTSYGITYTLTEYNYKIDDYIANADYNIVDPESTRYKKVYNDDGSYYYKTDEEGNFIPAYTNQSKATTDGETAEVKGVNNYATDNIEDIINSNILNVNFSNTYAPTSAITIKKQDSVTNNGLAGAKFSLFAITETTIANEDGTTTVETTIDENSPLKFTYNESIYTYDVDGKVTEITSPTGGSIIIDGLPSGKYKLKEMSVPDGYDGNSAVEVILSAEGSNVTVEAITKGTGKPDDDNKVLELDNASKLGQVKVTKAWSQNVPDEYLTSKVTVHLYLNNRPLSSYDLDNDGQQDNDLSKMQVELSQANNWSYTWDNLPLTIDGAEAKYSVVEVKIGDLSAVTTGKHNENGTWQSYDAYTQYRAYTTEQHTQVTGDTTTVEFELINDFHFVKIDINKISPLGVPIEDVTFQLYKLNEDGERVLISEETALKDGKITFKDLEYDTKYILIETKANKGYYLDDTEIYLIIKKGEQQGAPDRIVLYTTEAFQVEAQESDYAEDGYYGKVSLSTVQSTGETVLNIINVAHTPMPKAGGCGVYVFYILGIFLMGSSTIIIYLRKNKIKKGR